MGVSWTEEQQKVIRLRDRNILVSAAAGSGKTAVLVERIITMLTRDEDPVSVDELLIVTFTEAAAAEMKERIRNAIEKKLEEDPDSEHLRQQATLIHNAQITTIHSFCLSVIRDHFHATTLDPGFRVGEEGELKLLRQDVLRDMLEEKYQEGSREFLDFVSAYGGSRNDRRLEEWILKIHEFSRSYPDASGWLRDCVRAYEAEDAAAFEESSLAARIKERTEQYLKDAEEMLSRALDVCMEEDGPAAYEGNISQDMRLVEEMKQARTYEGLQKKMAALTFSRLAPNRKKEVSEEKAAYVKEVRDEVKKLLQDLKEQYYYQDLEEMLGDLKVCRPFVQVLTELVESFASEYQEAKESQNLIDFSDMEQYALQILTEKKDGKFFPSSIAEEYQQQFREVMIDEYQDSNLIQETILTSVSSVSQGRYNIFMVGDVKQSIYRFRLSRPELFMEKFHTYDLEDSKTQRIDLHKNFRSRPEVLDGANRIFRQIMAEDLGGVAYDDQAALYPGAVYPEGTDADTEILVLDAGGDEAKGMERKLEARLIAGRIRRLMEEGQVMDKESGLLRPVKYSDIVILIRSIQGYADVFVEELGREGIPAHAGTKEGYFKAREIGILLDYLRVLDNFDQDLPLAAVLTSPIGGFSEEELAKIRSVSKDVPFYEAVSRYPETEEAEETVSRKLMTVLEQIRNFRKIVPYTPIHELLLKILDETGIGNAMSAMPGGEQRRANLEMLIEKARTFESASYKGLFHFVRYMEQLQKYNVDYGEASIEDEQSDTVRIMTIHKSKGLEFPVVFVAGMGKRFNMQDARSSAALHSGMGIGLDAVRLEERTKMPSLVKKVIQKEEMLDSLGEELRVLYVALTRAKEKLIITGTLPDAEKKIASYGNGKRERESVLSFTRRSRAVTYWDWILPAAEGCREDAPLKIRIVGPEEITEEAVEEETAGRILRKMLEECDLEQEYDADAKAVIDEQFPYKYPYAGSRQQKMKFTVSELKKRAYLMENAQDDAWDLGEEVYEEPEVVPLLPKFLQEEETLKGASRGTAYHRAMELLDFAAVSDLASVAHSLKVYQKQGRITAEMTECIRAEDLMAFLESPCGRRMRRAAKEGLLYREQPFVLGIDARELYPEEQEGEMLLVQGIIDAYFEENGELVVLDYKTDQIFSPQKLAEKYHAQLQYYARALEQMTGKKVKEKIIYSFTMKKEIQV